ncbi:MAG: hypothetical protein MUO76_24485 [Anaerolineaceae bacterium]|nr:hypothetical protein [Anaerolineaceae bacterium]
MKISKKINIPLIIASLVISISYLLGIATIPFHPDESTQIFMSSDVEMFFTQPQGLFWHNDKETDIRQKYRELDAPITRYMIGIGRFITTQPSLSNDWNWSETWEENKAFGALPDNKLLNISRFSVAILFPLSIIMMYFIGKSIGNRFVAWGTFLLFSGNSLVLLHSRRAMAESVLLFGIIFCLYLIIILKDKPWIFSISSALAFNAKQSAAVFFILGLISILWSSKNTSKIIQIIKNFGIYILIFLSITILLNPFLWSDPINAGLSAWEARSDLVHRQVTTIGNLDPNRVLDSIPKRVASMIAQIYFTPPATADVGNYLEYTAALDKKYSENFLHHIFSGFVAGGILIFLTLLGFSSAFKKVVRARCDFEANWKLILMILATLLQTFTILMVIPISFQRYYVPLVPFQCLWTAYGLNSIFEIFSNRRSKPTKK